MTRVEVATAFVVAAVVLVTAGLIFKVVERSAGNARAMSKILALRQVVEEYVSEGQGYPELHQVRVLWAHHRKRDYLLSPWGGHVGLALDEATGSRGIEGLPFADILARRHEGPARGGGIGYMVAPNSQASVRLYDVQNTSLVPARFFAAFYYDPDGVYPQFPIGGR